MTTTHAIGLDPRAGSAKRELDPEEFGACRERFAEQGFLLFRGIVDRARLEGVRERIVGAFDDALRSGSLFSGGGLVSGHLNCFPGEESRFVYDSLERRGVIRLVRALAQTHLSMPNVGCNLNLPSSTAQNYHVDGYAAEPFLIVNVAAVDTDLVNGAMDVLERTHARRYKYWELVLANPPSLRVTMKQGDALVRTSVLWHRGMPNLSLVPRPMLAFTWEHGGSGLDDPYLVGDGKIAFFPNRYGTDLAGKLRERAFAAAPAFGSAYRFARSLFER